MNRLSAVLTTLLLAFLSAGTAVANDTVYYYSSDTVRSEVVITDANRNVVEQTNYAPYGQVLNRSLRDGPGYTGHEEDPESSLSYMQQRYFDPQCGRFLSNDSVATTDDGGGFNRYAYVNDNPYRYLDPDGNETTGEFIDEQAQSAANQDDHVAMFLWAFAGTTWTYLGAESVSQVVDKGSDASTSDKVMAAVTILTLGKGEEAATIGKDLAQGAKGASNIVYRGLAAGENAAAGLTARAPGIGNSVASHVAGARASQWISATRSLEIAKSRFGQNGVVAIDLNKVSGTVVDLTQGIPGMSPNTMLSRWAMNAKEVVIQDSVSASAITPVTHGSLP